MKIHRFFVHLSWAIISIALFFHLDSQGTDNLLYAESSVGKSAGSSRVEEIRRENIIFKAESQKTKAKRSHPSGMRRHQRQTIRPRISPTTTGTIVSAPGHRAVEGMSLARVSTKRQGSKPARRVVGSESLQETIDDAYECLLRGKKAEARKLYTKALFMETSRERRGIIKKHLDALNKELLFSLGPGPGSVLYEVKAGDNLTKIAKKFKTTPGLIMKINRKKDSRIRVKEPLKILTGTPSIVVNKKDFTLTLLIDGCYVREYYIGTGKNNSTPEGTFVVSTRLKNPVWYSPEGVYPFGHPKNVLGTRWLGFKNEPGIVGYGIHGTTKPESIGTESSNGCIRLRNEDVEELYDFVTPDTRVVIRS